MGNDLQGEAVVREIFEARTGKATTVTHRPELMDRSVPAVEELWESASHRYAVEHTSLESYSGCVGTTGGAVE